MQLKVRLFIAIAGALGVLALVFFAQQRAFHAGEQAERHVWEQRQAQDARDRAEITGEATRLGNRAAAAAIDGERAERDFSQQLLQERAHAVLTVPTAACAARHPARVAAAVPVPASDSASQPSGEQARGDLGQAAGARADAAVPLTADAVRLWNSALTGVREPAGDTCGTDAGAAVACAAGRPITVDDAWDNQADNALRCRIDRGRYLQLIELLRQRQALQGSQHGQ